MVKIFMDEGAGLGTHPHLHTPSLKKLLDLNFPCHIQSPIPIPFNVSSLHCLSLTYIV
jgi:hypothetical protein